MLFQKIVLFLALVLTSQVYAAKTASSNKEKDFKWIKSSQMSKKIKAARKRHQARKLASFSQVDPGSMTETYKNLITKVLNAKSSSQIASLIATLEKDIDSMPNDAKFVGTQLLLLKPLRGIIYRMIPLAAKENITHSFLRTQVKALMSNINIYLPGEHWKAGFAYITEPFKVGDKVISQFDDQKKARRNTPKISAAMKFQTFLENELYPAMAQASQRLEGFNLYEPIIWDNKIVFGEDSFKDNFEDTRFRNIGEAEKLLTLSSLHLGMHYLNYIISYNMEGSMNLAKSIGRLYGIDALLSRDIEGISSYDWVNVVNRSKYSQVGTLRNGRQENMKLSYSHLQQGVRYLRIAREELRNASPNASFVINPARINIWDENIEKQFKHIECLTADSTEDTPSACPIRSAITGHTIIVNLKNLYHQPPKDIKAFLPTGWNKGSKMLKKFGKSYPNYSWGQPNSWQLAPYKKHIFPELKRQSDVPKYVRTLRQSFGGEAFGIPLALFVE